MNTTTDSTVPRTDAVTFASLRDNHSLLPSCVNVSSPDGLTITAQELAKLHLDIDSRRPALPANLPAEPGTYRFVTEDGATAYFSRRVDADGRKLDRLDLAYPESDIEEESAKDKAGWRLGFMDVVERRETGYRQTEKRIIRSSYWIPPNEGNSRRMGVEEYDDHIRALRLTKIDTSSGLKSKNPGSHDDFEPSFYGVIPMIVEPSDLPLVRPGSLYGALPAGPSWRVSPDNCSAHKGQIQVNWSNLEMSTGLDNKGRHDWQRFIVHSTTDRSQQADPDSFDIVLPESLCEDNRDKVPKIVNTTCFVGPRYKD
jgi:hypothetical protein